MTTQDENKKLLILRKQLINEYIDSEIKGKRLHKLRR